MNNSEDLHIMLIIEKSTKYKNISNKIFKNILYENSKIRLNAEVEISQTFFHPFHFSPSTDFTNCLPPFSLFTFHFLSA